MHTNPYIYTLSLTIPTIACALSESRVAPYCMYHGYYPYTFPLLLLSPALLLPSP